ncbi:MAG: ornithine carbamoyltransferase [Desulfobacteraceae bacterium 4572_130]|nr:MAG: ornithine carbamoyltransferase [Desulfobacteraceae bacterium 4572_130]
MNKNILSLLDLTKDDFLYFFKRSLDLKKRFKQGIPDRLLLGKSLGLIFEKKSTRTRLSFETAMIQLGGTPIYISTQDTQMARNEPIKDTSKVISRYVDAVAIRTSLHTNIEEFAKYSHVPVINALTDLFHPCQVLSDLMTIIENKNTYKNIKIAWVGDGNNVLNSWVNAAAVLDLNLIVACPDKYSISNEIKKNALSKNSKNSKNVIFTNNPKEAVKNADVIYTDVWASMGQKSEQKQRIKDFKGFQINKELVSKAKNDVIIMHCLPAHRGEEISQDILDDPKGIFWDQAENKMHMHKAVLEKLIMDNI